MLDQADHCCRAQLSCYGRVYAMIELFPIALSRNFPNPSPIFYFRLAGSG
eukprot:jgi/Botrbrau1/1248/Bobra.0163s0041.1